jgi:hypothetical protein
MANNRPWRSQSLIVGAAIVLILVTGLIHLVEGPDQLSDAAYVGVLFFLNAAGAALAAIGIYRGVQTWGWGLGLFVAGGALLMYIISRTVGLPGLEVEPWFEPIGVLSMIVESLFVLLSIVYLMRFAKPRTRTALSTSINQPVR